MKAVILAASPAERLRPFTDNRAKPMIRVAGETILEKTTAGLKSAGINEVALVVNHRREGIQSYFEHGHRFGLVIEYVLQEPVDGIGAAVARCREVVQEEAFLLVYGDVLTTGALFETVLGQHLDSGGAIAALSLPASSRDFGNVYLSPDLKISRLVEKPTDPHLSNYVFAGVFVLPGSFFDLLEEEGNNMEKAFQRLIADGALSGTIWEGDWIDVRLPWDILEANRIMMRKWDQAIIHESVTLEGNVRIEGAVHIQENVVVGSGTVLKGPCFIGQGSYVGNNTLIREYTSLGPESVVGYGTELKNCVLLGRSTLGRLSFIGDSVIGERVHIGTGVTTVNVAQGGRPIEVAIGEELLVTGMTKVGAFIGDDVHIGARQVLAPGTIIRSGYVSEDLVTLRNNP